MEPAPAPFDLLRSRTVLETYHFDVEEQILAAPEGGEPLQRMIEVHRGTAAVIAADEDGLIHLIEQYRIPLRRWTLEVPAGGIDPGENLEEAVVRELREETGLIATELRPLGEFANAPGHSTQLTRLFEAPHCRRGERTPIGPEEASSRIHRLTPDALDAAVRDGRIFDAKSLVAIARTTLR